MLVITIKVSTKIYLKDLESWKIPNPTPPSFFLAQDLDQTLAMAGTFVGTVTYMSPERCLGAMRIMFRPFRSPEKSFGFHGLPPGYDMTFTVCHGKIQHFQ